MGRERHAKRARVLVVKHVRVLSTNFSKELDIFLPSPNFQTEQTSRTLQVRSSQINTDKVLRFVEGLSEACRR